ncbi:MAG: hypothetical protein MJA29_12970 [Candidatus Omnitrophica bacterium]|nr:hypothetical protein [Candidatus Omnitrophota bacterium]
MRNKWHSRTGLSAVEYAVLILVFVATILGISVYLKRAVSGKYRSAADVFGYGRQYEP